MNNKMIAAVVGVVVLGGAGWYFLSANNNGSDDAMQAIHPNAPIATTTDTAAVHGSATSSPLEENAEAQAGTSESAAQAQTGAGSIGSLLAMNQSLSCTVVIDTSGAKSTGTMYVSGGKIRGDFVTTVSGKQMHASLINDGTTIYTWSDITPRGVKFAVSSQASASAKSRGYSMSTPVDYKCSPWTADASQFTPPSSVSFYAI